MIATFTRFDLRNIFSPGARTLLPLAFVALVAIVAPLPEFAVAVAVAVGAVGASGPFLSDERGRLDTLYATMPIGRTSVVVGRYATLVIYYLIAAAIATVVGLAAEAVRGASLDVDTLLVAHVVGFFAVAVALSLQLPFFFSVGFTKARPMMYIPIGVMAAALWSAAQFGLLDDIAMVQEETVRLLGAGLLVVGAALLAASASIAAARYRRRAV